MRQYFGIIIAAILIIAVLIALSAAGNVEFDQPNETEASPNRSSYNAGSTGTRAFYQLLEESGLSVTRWREEYKSLEQKAKDATLIAVGPYQFGARVSEEETSQLRSWVANGGQLLIVSRTPRQQFGDTAIHSEFKEKTPPWETPPEQAAQIVDEKSDELIAQPTDLTRNLSGLALSGFAARMKFYVDVSETKPDSIEEAPSPTPLPSPSASPESSPESPPTPLPEKVAENQDEEEDIYEPLYAPVVHLGDRNGSVLADFHYGKGRIVILSDPFVIANNGIARGANLTLAMNLIRSLGAGGRQFLFDEFHHGYQSASNPLFDYFRGTPMPWLAFQGGLLAAFLLYTYGRRFARPIPLPLTDRHSPLEFVGSMANLQQVAEARDLALENIYPRFKAKLCRRLGLSSRAQIEEIVEAAQRQRMTIPADELRQTLSIGEAVLKGGKIVEEFDDTQLIKAVGTMRRIIDNLKG